MIITQGRNHNLWLRPWFFLCAHRSNGVSPCFFAFFVPAFSPSPPPVLIFTCFPLQDPFPYLRLTQHRLFSFSHVSLLQNPFPYLRLTHRRLLFSFSHVLSTQISFLSLRLPRRRHGYIDFKSDIIPDSVYIISKLVAETW